MRRHFSLSAMALFIMFQLTSFASWTRLSSPTTEHLYSLSFPSSSTAFAAGAKGTLLKSADSGKTWSKLLAPVAADFNGITFLSETKGFAFGLHSVLLETSNAGSTWQTRDIAGSHHFWGMSFGSADLGILVGYNRTTKLPSIHRTIDAGRTWTAVQIPSSVKAVGTLFSVHMYDESYGVACGEHDTEGTNAGKPLLLVTYDGGLSWDYVATSTSVQPLNQVVIVSPEEVIAVGYDEVKKTGILYKSIDAGATWAAKEMSLPYRPWSVAAASSTNFFVCGTRLDQSSGTPVPKAEVLVSSDGGQTWTLEDPGFGISLTSMAVTPNQTLAAVGLQGVIGIRQLPDCPLPHIESEFPNTVTLPLGGTFNLSVRSQGSGLSYQWMKDGEPLEWQVSSGITIMNLGPNHEGTYRVDVTNNCGTVSSSEVQLVVEGMRSTSPLTVYSDILSFGEVMLSARTTRTFPMVLQNNGSASLKIDALTISDDDADAFSIPAEFRGPRTLQPGEFLSIPVQFTAKNADIHFALLHVIPENRQYLTTLVVEGYGVPNIPPIKQITQTMTMIDFGPLRLGTAVERTYRVAMNVGNEALSIQKIDVEGEGFTLLTPNPPLRLEKDSMLTVRLRYTQSNALLNEGYLTIVSEAGSITIPMSGELDRSRVIDFGETAVNRPVDTTIEWSHMIVVPQTVTRVESSNPDFEVVRTSPQLPATLQAFQPIQITVRFKPTRLGSHAGSLRLAYSDQNGEFYSSFVMTGSATTTTSTDDPASVDNVVGYPNPTSDRITFVGPAPFDKIEVSDSRGLVVKTVFSGSGIDTNDLPAGLYTARLYRMTGIQSYRFVVVR